MLHRLLMILLILHGMMFKAMAQQPPEAIGISSDTLTTDSLKVIEDAPLDIAQNRGLFIVTPDRKMQLRILGSIRFLLVYDNKDLLTKNSLITTEIPTGDQNKPFPNYYNSLNQTRLGFEATRRTETGNLFVRLETDFAGANGFRIRHAYGQYRGWIIGQTWSLFTQISVLPATVNFNGPTSAILTRTPQVRYTFYNRSKSDFAISLEYQVQDIEVPDSLDLTTFQLLPNLTGRFNRNFNWGLLQISGVMPVLSVRDATDELFIRFGWGVSIGALVKPWPSGSFHFQGAGGQSISRFFADIEQNFNVQVGPNNEVFLPYQLGFYGAYQHDWTNKLYTNVAYGRVQLEELSFTPQDIYKWGSTWHLNAFYRPVDGAKTGIELIWGTRTDKSSATGDAFRFNILAYYDF